MVSQLTLASHALSHEGLKRPHNEDAYLCDDDLGLFLVADGVGGHAKGEVASAETVEQVHCFVREGRAALDELKQNASRDQRQAVRRLLESAVQSACYMVFGLAEQDPEQRGMSTTISALLVVGDHGYTAQVGDSRIYRIREGQGVQLTEDHTLVNHRLKTGLITPEQARTMRGRNVITRAVGHKDYVEVDTRELDVWPGDCFLLCSDGLHGYLEAGELEQVVAAGPIEEAPARCVALANERGGKDNITVVLVCVAAPNPQ